MRTASAITLVIDSNLESERALKLESAAVSPERQAVLMRLADQRHLFAEQLERLAATDNLPKIPFRTRLRELGLKLRKRISSARKDDVKEDGLASCRHSEARTQECYTEALSLDWPYEIRAVLAAQSAVVHGANEELSKLAS